MYYKLSSRFPYVKKQNDYNLDSQLSNELVQRVIIPQGLVNPSQTTVIEIPYHFQDTPTVIAKPKEDCVNKQYSNNISSVNQYKKCPQASNTSARTNTSALSRTPVKTRTVIETTKYTEEVPLDNENTYTMLDSKAKELLRSDSLQVPSLEENNIMYDRLPQSNHSVKSYKAHKSNFIPVDNVQEDDGYSYTEDSKTQKQVIDYNIKLPIYSTAKTYPYMEHPESNLNTVNYFVDQKYPFTNSYEKYQSKNNHLLFETKNNPEEELKDVLDNLDLIETARIQRELKQFQKARRKSIYDAAIIKH